MAASASRCARRRDVPVPGLCGRSRWRALALVAGVLLILCQLSCGDTKTIIQATLTGVPDSAASLRINAFLDRLPTQEPPSEIRKPPASSLTYFRAEVPVSEVGELKLDVLVLDADECAVAHGEATLTLAGPGVYAVPIEVEATTGCQLVLNKVGEGTGSVTVFTDSSQKSYTFDRPPQEMPSCPLAANYPSSQTLTFPIRTHVRLQASVEGDSLNGSLFGTWGDACVGRGGCEFDITEVQTKVSVSFNSSTLCTSSGVCWRHPLPQGNTLRHVAGRNAVDVWAVGDRGTIVRWNGSYWTSPRRPFEVTTLNSVWAEAPPGTALLAVGEQGITRTLSQEVWSCPQAAGTSTLRDSWGTAFGDIWAVGDKGTLAHWDGSKWTLVSSPAGATIGLNAVLGRSAKEAWAVGEMGTVLRYDGTSWSRVSVPITDTLNGLWQDAGGDVWAVGDNGVALLLSSRSLTAEVKPTGTTVRLHGIWGIGPGEVWAAGAFGTIL